MSGRNTNNYYWIHCSTYLYEGFLNGWNSKQTTYVIHRTADSMKCEHFTQPKPFCSLQRFLMLFLQCLRCIVYVVPLLLFCVFFRYGVFCLSRTVLLLLLFLFYSNLPYYIVSFREHDIKENNRRSNVLTMINPII